MSALAMAGNADYYATYTTVLLVVLAGVAFAAVAFGANRLLRPHRPTREKLLTYESGVDPVGEGWAQTHVRYYVYAYLYVVFAVDAIFLFPWATVFAAPGFGWATLTEMFVFIGFIAVGLLYAWRKGVLTWT
ncbi:NADH-quinone oxidoreductase subunit A [Actinopolymorpha cephalotaxi]|uniref:NADH-quinone oxidoreductase subunit A n=1 Tax=Actinopolymorpha cephalotaxi TaxID=504797 RepID=A0A1I2NN89_9ACTN|nr:NADH-quinone oxidoreductase subunit A [Actinopolymorpha cephalotaxi]NYH85441.1 NADH-quinone oxidoreductase subunit A [Actinopolymorpha cephalotaxi]SFG05043.1 NADH-quinone oxidoreductase subunit A [Actinopolymorpha cephalotaxi]